MCINIESSRQLQKDKNMKTTEILKLLQQLQDKNLSTVAALEGSDNPQISNLKCQKQIEISLTHDILEALKGNSLYLKIRI